LNIVLGLLVNAEKKKKKKISDENFWNKHYITFFWKIVSVA